MGRPLLAPFREAPWAPAHAIVLPRVLGEQSMDRAENEGRWGRKLTGTGKPGSRANHKGQCDQVCLCHTEHIPGE